MSRIWTVAFALALAFVGCEPVSDRPVSGEPTSTRSGTSIGPVTSAGPALRYVAFGDSYTIGTSVGTRERWPDQLVASLGPTGGSPTLDLVANLAANGYTSQDVIDRELPELVALRPEFVTLLVGVNDVVRGVPAETYERNAVVILDELLRLVSADRIIVVTTPDYTVTPAGSDYGDPIRQSAAIRAVNGVLSTLAETRGIRVVDIYDLSLRAATDRSLVASDGLHPSGRQYALWVERIGPAVQELLGQ